MNEREDQPIKASIWSQMSFDASHVKKLTGARVSAPDLRAGAALVIAGLAADGITIVDDIVYIQRGYENFEEKLRSLGAEIERVSSEKEIQKFRLRVG